MCGIAGFCATGSVRQEINKQLLHAMQKAMLHRGPDGHGTWVSQEHGIGLAHRRLSIIDISSDAAQPMLDKMERVTLSFNGEIYNYQQLRTELQKLGVQFVSRSDTEVIIQSYLTWGFEKTVERLDGMFAFALFDREKNIFHCVRDRIGIKPLYFSLQSGFFSFASEIKALWRLPWIAKNIQPHAVYHYLTYLAVPAPLTLYEGVYKLPPGFSVTIDAHRNILFKKWYDLLAQIPACDIYTSEQEIIAQLTEHIDIAVQKRMVADVPVGVFLSGGVDSSLTTALMARHTDQVNSFTVSFKDGPEYNEHAYAQRVANYFGTKHHEIEIDEQDAFECYQTMVHHQDEPIGDSVCVPLYYVAQLLKQSGLSVVQVGEGADELFCGYSQYTRYVHMMRWWNRSQKYVPQLFRKGAYQLARWRYPNSMNNLDVLNNWVQGNPLFFSGAVVFSELWKRSLCNTTEKDNDILIKAFFPGMSLAGSSYAMADYYRNQLYTALPHADVMQMIGYLELMHRLPELLLMRVDKMTMAHSVEARVPFLDPALVAYGLGMPMRYKYHNRETKYILKKVCEQFLPHDIIYRPKMGFAAPTSRWYKSGRYFKPFLKELLSKREGEFHELLDTKGIQKMMQHSESERIDYSYQLWAVQNLLACDL